MKLSAFFLFLFSFMNCSIASASGRLIDFTRDSTPPEPRISSCSSLCSIAIPVSAIISETELSVYFESTVGYATINIYDAANQIVGQEVIDTNSTLELFIPVGTLTAGDYTVTITYGNTTLTGEFAIQQPIP